MLVTWRGMCVCSSNCWFWFEPRPTAAFVISNGEKHEITRVSQPAKVRLRTVVNAWKRRSSSESYFKNDSSVAHRGQLTIIQRDAGSKPAATSSLVSHFTMQCHNASLTCIHVLFFFFLSFVGRSVWGIWNSWTEKCTEPFNNAFW